MTTAIPDGKPAQAVCLPSWIRTIAFVLVGLVGLWFCVRATVLQLMEREYPLIGEAISPPSAVSQALISLNRSSARQGVADPLARELLESALRRAPLLADPFIVAGLDASARDDFISAQRLMEEASRRDPRAIIPRYWLFDNYLRNGDYVRGIAQAEPLLRLQPAAEPAAVAVLTALLPVGEARPALVSALRTGPAWRGAFFRQAAASPRLRGAAEDLLREASIAGAGTTGRDRLSVVNAMVSAGRYADAYALWLGAVPPDQRPSQPGLFDGNFRNTVAGAPFGWRLPAVGSTQRVSAPDAPSRSGLAIRTAGDRAALLAEQLVLAPKGSLRLRFLTRALDPSTENRAGVKVELRCKATKKPLASQIVEEFTPALAAHDLTSTMPSDCGALLVRALVVPGLEPGPLNILLTGMVLKLGKSQG